MSLHARLLRETPIFGAIREDIIDFLLGHCRTVDISANSWLMREGDESGSMFIIEEGEVAILKAYENRQYLLSTLGRGDCIGEMALFDLMPRSASALAVTRSHLLEISAASLLDLYERDVEQFALIQMNMGREVTRRLRLCEERLFQRDEFPQYDLGPTPPEAPRGDALPSLLRAPARPN